MTPLTCGALWFIFWLAVLLEVEWRRRGAIQTDAPDRSDR